MHMLVNMVFGSHLYGTNTESSDKDYKGIYLPSLKEVVLESYAKGINEQSKEKKDAKNTAGDVDVEIYSLQKFLDMAFRGETVCIDMIHARDTIIDTSPEREFIYQNRAKFYTKDMKAYIGYCKNQAAKYGIKGSRLNDCKKILDMIEENNCQGKLLDYWDKIEETENVKKIVIEEHVNGDNRFLDVCGKQFQITAKVSMMVVPLKKFYEQYGGRAVLAAQNEGIDWKAVSHAFRAGLQLIEILETGDLTYPLKDRQFIMDIKYGKFHYVNDRIGEQLDELIDKCNTLAAQSDLPEKVDRDFWNDWVYSLYAKDGSESTK